MRSKINFGDYKTFMIKEKVLFMNLSLKFSEIFRKVQFFNLLNNQKVLNS